VKKVNPEAEVEGELGYLATDSSRIYAEEVVIPEDSYTKPQEAMEFVRETGVDRLAPAIGTIHGIAANTPKLRFDLAQELRAALPGITLVLHGGSGVTDEEKERIAKAGFNNIHVSTELRVAFTGALRAALRDNPDEVIPYKYLAPAREATAKVVAHHVKLFGSANRA
ncbi:MAG: class II fructose-bisphosphate aldolase, partial [Candidatus Pacearchaeota archaeon]|nr:class II fructose-bisphosphate aldolase [Candidatus Pacearchaeota archaeon]